MIVDALVWVAAASLIAIGSGAIVAPVALSERFGVPVTEASALVYVRAAGTRDVILGALIAYAQLIGAEKMVGGACIAGAVLALADFVVTLGPRSGHARRVEFSHLAGFALFAVVTYLTLHR